MPYFQVIVETRPDSGADPGEALPSRRYVIVNKRPFATLEEVITAAAHETRYPDAEMYAIEAQTPREASAIFRHAEPSKLRLIRKRL